jgi:predicted nicotinamide N-methyase
MMTIDTSSTAADDENIKNDQRSIDIVPFSSYASVRPIYFHEDWNVGIGGGLWSTGLAMAYYFSQHSSVVCACLSNLKVNTAIELGSGNGFVSVCFLASLTSQCQLKELVLTDLEEQLPFIQRTLNANRHIVRRFVVDYSLFQNSSDSSDSSLPLSSSFHEEETTGSGQPLCGTMETNINVIVAMHSWGEFTTSAETTYNDRNFCARKFDFIFASDVAYQDNLHQPLIQSLVHFSHDRTIILLGVTMNDTKPIFFDALWNAGFTYARIADNDCAMPEYRGKNFGLFILQRRPA